jgi:hypothetical protein
VEQFANNGQYFARALRPKKPKGGPRVTILIVGIVSGEPACVAEILHCARLRFGTTPPARCVEAKDCFPPVVNTLLVGPAAANN